MVWVWIILLAHVFYNVAIVIRIVGGFWANLDPRQVDAARVLGAGRWQVLREITLPLLALALSVFLVYVIMAAQFESLIYPASMICTILFSVIGVYWFFLITGTTFTLMAMIGILILIGVVLISESAGTPISKGYVYFAMGFSLMVMSPLPGVIHVRATAFLRLPVA